MRINPKLTSGVLCPWIMIFVGAKPKKSRSNINIKKPRTLDPMKACQANFFNFSRPIPRKKQNKLLTKLYIYAKVPKICFLNITVKTGKSPPKIRSAKLDNEPTISIIAKIVTPKGRFLIASSIILYFL